MTNMLLNIATSNSGCEMIIAEFVFQVKFLHYLWCVKPRICFMSSEQLKISVTPVKCSSVSQVQNFYCVLLITLFSYSSW